MSNAGNSTESDTVRRPKVYIDTDVLVAAAGSAQGASHIILKLSELTLIEGVISEAVRTEAERNIMAKLPQAVPVYRALLRSAKLQNAPLPQAEDLQTYQGQADAKDLVHLVAATLARCDYLVTHNTVDYPPQPGTIEVVTNIYDQVNLGGQKGMSRLGSQSDAGYVPSPPIVVERVARMIAPGATNAQGPVRLLDPCCGEGAALAQLGARLKRDGAVVETYGVELHRGRHEEARVVLDHALCSDAFQAAIANGAFQLMLLNPPYDHDQEKRRLEHKFLLHCTRYLAPGGLLVFIVPQARLHVSARCLASRAGRRT